MTNDLTNVESIQDSNEDSMEDEILLCEVEMKPRKSVLSVTRIFQWRSLVSESSATSKISLDYSVFCWPKLYLAAILTFVLLSDIAQHGAEPPS